MQLYLQENLLIYIINEYVFVEIMNNKFHDCKPNFYIFFIFRKITQLRDGHSLPPSDNLIRFIMESTYEDFPSCANCDRNEKSQMFFCNTCGKSTSNFCLTQIYYIHQPTPLILKVLTSFFAKSGSLYLYGQNK